MEGVDQRANLEILKIFFFPQHPPLFSITNLDQIGIEFGRKIQICKVNILLLQYVGIKEYRKEK